MTITKQIYSEIDGSQDCYPVMIKIEHHGLVKWIPTSVTCREEHWDNQKCLVSEEDTLYRIKNEAIESQLRRVAGKIQDHLDNYLSDNLETICDNFGKPNFSLPGGITRAKKHGLTLFNLIESKIETISTLNTRRGYISLFNYCKTIYGNPPLVESINRTFISDFDLKLRKDYSSRQPTLHLMLARMRAVLNHARENGTLPLSVTFKLPKVPLRPRDRNLSETAIRNIFQLYKKSLSTDPELRRSSTFALGLFVLDIAFQGLAPVDFASLRINQIRISYLFPPEAITSGTNNLTIQSSDSYEQYEPLEVIIIRTSRQKTGQQVTIVASYKPLRQIVDTLMRGKNEDDYLIPCFNSSRKYTPEQRQDRLANYFYKISCQINEAMKHAEIDRDEMGEHRRVTFYYARHAFCNLIDGLDVPRHLIQHMIGHRTTVLETNYLRKITPWEQAQLSNAILSPLID